MVRRRERPQNRLVQLDVYFVFGHACSRFGGWITRFHVLFPFSIHCITCPCLSFRSCWTGTSDFHCFPVGRGNKVWRPPKERESLLFPNFGRGANVYYSLFFLQALLHCHWLAWLHVHPLQVRGLVDYVSSICHAFLRFFHYFRHHTVTKVRAMYPDASKDLARVMSHSEQTASSHYQMAVMPEVTGGIADMILAGRRYEVRCYSRSSSVPANFTWEMFLRAAKKKILRHLQQMLWWSLFHFHGLLTTVNSRNLPHGQLERERQRWASHV